MARHKDIGWNVPEQPQTWEQVQVSVLMDIRDELKRLNSLLQCPNFVAVPRKLDDIKAELRQVRLNTRKRKKAAKPKLRAGA